MASSGATSSVRTPRARIALLAIAMAAAAIPLHVFALRPDVPVPPMALPWWAIAVGFLISETFSIRLRVKGDGHSASLSEIPLLLGLAAASATGLIVGRLLGAGFALVARHRFRGVRLAFNLSLSYLDSAAGLAIYRGLLGGHSPVSVVGLAVAAFALGATLVLNAGLVGMAILLKTPGRKPGAVVRSLGTGLLISGVASIVAIGGLMRQASIDDESGLPMLPKTIFGQTTKTTEKRELVILLKPTVVDSDKDWSDDIARSRERMNNLSR